VLELLSKAGGHASLEAALGKYNIQSNLTQVIDIEASSEVVKVLQYAKNMGKGSDDDHESGKNGGDDKKHQNSMSKSEKLEQELARILSKNNNKLFLTSRH